MPASLRAHGSRATSSRPYDRRPPTASSAQSENLLVHPYLSRNVPPTTIQAADADQHLADLADVPPDVPGLPTHAEYKRIEAGYLHSLSPRKRDKALITQAMFDKIWDVLHQPEACTIETPQFRFWVRKMFTLSRPVRGDSGGGWCWGEEPEPEPERAGGNSAGMATHPVPVLESDADRADLELERSMGIGLGRSGADELGFSAVVLHENRPVAILEQLYELFCYCHVRAGHGGRDKTCAVIREHYSWVPKELTAQFVKACPTCALKRSGHAHGGVGVGVGVLAHRRVVERGGKRGRATPLEAEETPVSMGPSSLGWPTTGGPLDPANPEPCGMREREWSHTHEDGRAVGPSGPASVSPGRGSRMQSTSREAPLESRCNTIPRALTVFHPWNTTSSLGHPIAVDNNGAQRRDQEETRSPTRTELPSLASALSNESLDENVNLTAPKPGEATDSDSCLLPSALRPLRLLGPVPSDSDSEPPASYPFQIDPVLLSFNYPGLGLSNEPESGFASDLGPAIPLALSAGTCMSSEENGRGPHGIVNRNVLGPSGCRLRAPSDVDGESPRMSRYSINMPALDPSRESDSPDSSFERAASYTSDSGVQVAMLPFSLSTEFMQNRCGSPGRYGYRDGPLARLYHSNCSADEVGQELDGPLSFPIMTDT